MNYSERVDLLMTIAVTAAPEMMCQACKRFPQLKNAKRIAMADFFGTIVLLDTAKRAIATDIAESQRESVTRMLLSKVREWSSSAEAAFNDLERHRTTMSRSVQTATLPKDFFAGVAGAWITWNITDKEPISDERAIMSLLGFAFVNGPGLAQIWTVESI
jgi:hypothetical protein